MKKLISLMVIITLLMTCVTALAENYDQVLFRATETEQYYIQSSVALGDTLYAVDWENLFRFELGDEAPTKLTFDKEPNVNLRAIMQDGGQLYAFVQSWTDNGGNDNYVAPVIIEGDTAKLGERIALDWKGVPMRDGYLDLTETTFMHDGHLIASIMDESYENETMMIFSIADGTRKDITMKGRNVYAPYTAGKLIMLSRVEWEKPWQLDIMDMAGGSVENVAELGTDQSDIGGIAYNESLNRLCYVMNGQLMAMQGTDKSTELAVNDMPGYSNSRAGNLMDNGYYFAAGYDIVPVRNTDPDKRPTRTLHIAGGMNPDDGYFAFKKMHPEVSVLQMWSSGDDKIVQDMMARSKDVDIYMLNMTGSAYKALTNRGYVAEISSEVIRSEIADFYAPIQDAVHRDGKLIGVPTDFSSTGLCFSKDTAEVLKLTEDDMPTTWAEMIDFIAGWDDRFGQEFPLIKPLDPPSMAALRSNLLTMILNDYVAFMDVPGAQQTFNSPVLREVLQKLDATDFSGVAEEPSIDGSYGWSSDEVLFVNEGGTGFQSWSNERQVDWPLSFVKGELPPAAISLTVCVINPFSENQDIAEQYLEQVILNLPKTVRMTFDPNVNETMRPSYYWQSMQYYEKEVELLKETIKTASEDEKKNAEEILADLERYAKQAEETEWIISRRAIDEYRKQAGNLVVLTGIVSFYAGYGSDNAEIQDLFARYEAKQLQGDQFITQLENKLRMMQMEGY